MYTKQRFLVVLIGAALASFAGAQSMPYQPPPDNSANYGYDNPAPAQNDPPARVARLSYLDGSVSFTPAGENDWVQAQVNRPIVTGDKLWTDAGGRAELQLGSSTVVLDRSSNFDFLNLDDQLAQMELTQGSLNLNVGRLNGSESYEVDTPTLAFVADRVGDYRINVDADGGTTVTAMRGAGDAIGEGGKRVTVEEGQSVRFPNSQLIDYQVNQIGAPDQFDNYARERVARYENAPRPQYVSADVVGYQDLDQYGSWEDAPDYGHVWYPREVAGDWAPYHDGHWAWIDPWGWTWVDNAPWGYAPFHYGRWAYVNSRWGWVPGPVDVAPVYAPALVAFVGGGGLSVGVSFGGPVGWFALGPHDVYFPGYRCGHDYFTRVNVGNAYVNRTIVNNYYGSWSSGSVNYASIRYANRDAPRAVAAMPANAFIGGRPVASSAIAVNRQTFANARVMARPAVVPTRESLVAGRGRAPAPPTAAVNRTVVAANRPPAPVASFAQRQAVLQKNGGQPLTRNQLHTLSAQQGGNGRAAVANNVRVVGSRGSAVPARAAAATNDRGSNTGRGAGNGNQSTQAEANARASSEASGRAQNNARVAGQTPSRAPEMNRSPDRANAQYLRSSGYAHQGVAPGSERATNAQQNRADTSARVDERAQARARQEQNRGPAAVGRSNASQQQGQQHLNSASFAHGQNARGQSARGAPSESQRQPAVAANARDNASAQRNAAAARESTARNSGEQARNRETAQQNGRDQARAQQSARAEATARSQANERAQANARATESARTAQNNRAQEQQRAMAEQRQAQARSQASARTAESHAAQNNHAQEQQRAVAQQRVQHAPQPPQRSEPPRPQEQVAHAPPQQQQQRQAPQQRQVARQQPPQHAPKDDKKKNDNNGG